MYGGKGRKFVKERVGDEIRTNEHFKGIDHQQIENFDSEWDRAAKKMGFYTGSNALPSYEQPRGGGFSRSYKDNGRRGEYLPNSLNAPE